MREAIGILIGASLILIFLYLAGRMMGAGWARSLREEQKGGEDAEED